MSPSHITPDKERARSLLKTVEMREEAIEILSQKKRRFCTKILEEYYEIIIELITALFAAEGWKTPVEAGAHIESIALLRQSGEWTEDEIEFLNQLRKTRNAIKYYGRDTNLEDLERKEVRIQKIIQKLKIFVEATLKN